MQASQYSTIRKTVQGLPNEELLDIILYPPNWDTQCGSEADERDNCQYECAVDELKDRLIKIGFLKAV